MTDVVYFAARHGLVKIGTTGDLTTRIDQLNAGISAVKGMAVTPVELLATMPGSQPVERAIHEMFANLRYRGEWFLLAEPLAGFVQAVALAEAVAQIARGQAPGGAQPWRYVRDTIVPRAYRVAAELQDVMDRGASAPGSPATLSPEEVTVRQAVDEGLVPWSMPATQKRLQRSSSRPAPIRTCRGSIAVYRREELVAWVESQRGQS